MTYSFQDQKVLVVEDNQHMRALVNQTLRGFGIADIHPSGDGEEALEALQQFRATLIISDLIMPKMDGLTFVKKVRQGVNGCDPDTPIIMLTGHADRDKIVQARDAGVTAFLVKPFAPDHLNARILAILKAKQAAA